MRYLLRFLLLISSLSVIHSLDIDNVIIRHSLYISAQAQVEAAKVGLEKEYISYYPFGGSLSTNSYGSIANPDFNLSVGFSMNYKIFRPDVKKKIEERKILIDISREYERSVYQLLNYNINRLILNYNNSERLYNLALENYQSVETYTEKVRERFRGGDLSKSEKNYAESILLRHKAALIDSECLVKSSLLLFKNETQTELKLDEKMTDISFHNLYVDLSNKDIDMMITNDPDIKQVKLGIEREKSNRDNTKSNSIPNLSLSTSIKYPFDSSAAWQAGVSVNIPMFGIKYDKLSRKEIDYNILGGESKISKLIKDKKNNINCLKSRILAKESQSEIYHNSLVLSQSSYDGVLTESKAGTRTVFDVIEAGNNLNSIKRYIVESENALELLKLEYTFLTGGFRKDEN